MAANTNSSLHGEDIGDLEKNMLYFRVLASKRIKETPPEKNQSKLGEVSHTSNPTTGGLSKLGHVQWEAILNSEMFTVKPCLRVE